MDERSSAYQMLIIEIIFEIHIFQSDLVVGKTDIDLGFPFAVLHLRAQTHIWNSKAVFELALLRRCVERPVEKNPACRIDFKLWFIVLRVGYAGGTKKRC